VRDVRGVRGYLQIHIESKSEIPNFNPNNPLSKFEEIPKTQLTKTYPSPLTPLTVHREPLTRPTIIPDFDNPSVIVQLDSIAMLCPRSSQIPLAHVAKHRLGNVAS
jgi:hypothetical protein